MSVPVIYILEADPDFTSLIDRGTQYFLAGACRTSSQTVDITYDGQWFGCNTVPTPGGLCEVCCLIVYHTLLTVLEYIGCIGEG